MKGAALRWTVAGLAGLSILATAAGAQAQYSQPAKKEPITISDKQRVWGNFTREAATVEPGQLRMELRLFRIEENQTGGDPDCRGPLRKNCARLNGIGQRIIGVEDVKSGRIELIASYGIFESSEIGFILPGIIESFSRDDGSSADFADIGDITLYGKFTQEVAPNFRLGGGLELTIPPWNGLAEKERTVVSGAAYGTEGTWTGTSTGELGINPYLSGRYVYGKYAVGAHIGYTFYTDNDVEEVLNYSVHTLWRVYEAYSARLELNGRMWDQFGVDWHDVSLMPGIDYQLADNAWFRPTGMVGLTNTAADWGIGAGVAVTF